VKIGESSAVVERDLRTLLGDEAVLPGTTAEYLSDETETRGLHGYAEAVCFPSSSEQVVSVVTWCYERGIPIVPRGGGTGYAGGAVPVEGGVVVALERLARVRSFNPLLWRIEVDAGVRTADLRRVARENGLFFPPDPGAAEQSQIGGNVATNAGGPHTFKYGVTGAWVTGLEVVLPPSDLVRVGGSMRKDVAGYDVKSVLIGSEGTLGIVTAVWLKLIPAPERRCQSSASTATSVPAPRP
jgi:FAD/FMN-containing dehydrogenase